MTVFQQTRRCVSSFVLGAVSTAALVFVGTTIAGDERPKLDPSICNGCETEAAAYSQAVENLEAASQAVEDAYSAWVACMMSHKAGGDPEPNPISPEHSVLVD